MKIQSEALNDQERLTTYQDLTNCQKFQKAKIKTSNVEYESKSKHYQQKKQINKIKECISRITTAGLERACPSGPVIPSSIILFCPSNTASPFSAWTIAKAPRDLHLFSPCSRSSSFIMRDPLYAMKNLKELMPISCKNYISTLLDFIQLSTTNFVISTDYEV